MHGLRFLLPLPRSLDPLLRRMLGSAFVSFGLVVGGFIDECFNLRKEL
jgi:hypothetical protein